MRLNFTLYGSQFTYGWLPEGSRLIAPEAFLNDVVRRGFSGAEIPTRVLEGADDDELRRLRRLIERDNLEVVLSAFGTDTQYLSRFVAAAAVLGAPVLRTVVGGADYGGDRRRLRGRWQDFMRQVRDSLRPVVDAGSKAGVVLAVENHQDVASEDLLWLGEELGQEWFGVVLDTANPLATAEHPLTFTTTVLPLIRYVHLKDYVIYWSDEGYRLVRCPVGSGVIPLTEIISLLTPSGRATSASLELAAVEARHVRVFADDFWHDYPSRSAEQLASVLGFVHKVALPSSSDYRTPFERGASSAAISAWEEAELQESIRIMATRVGDPGPLRALTAG